MSVTIDLSDNEIDLLKQLTALEHNSDAAAKAVREFLRICQLRELKAVSGKVDYHDVSPAMEALELREQKAKS